MREALFAVALGTIACGPQPAMDPLVKAVPDAAVAEIDAAPTGPGDPTPDAAPAPTQGNAYPSGPYGKKKGSVIADLSWMGYAHGVSDAEPRRIYLHEYFSGNDPDAKIIQIAYGAGWCPACIDEASQLPSIEPAYEAKGVRFLDVLFEDDNSNRATTAYAKTWAEMFNLDSAVLADDTYSLDPYDSGGSVPLNLFIDARTMTILDKENGFDLPDEEQTLDYYLAQ